MVDCDYCSETIDGEEDYLLHLHDEHYESLGRIDKRRVHDEFGSPDGGQIPRLYWMAGIAGFLVGLILFTVLVLQLGVQVG